MSTVHELIILSAKCEQFLLRWDCLLLPEKAGFFLNNLVAFALIGAPISLLRPTQLLQQLYILTTSRTWTEVEVRASNCSDKFWVGEDLVWNLIKFTIGISLSFACPFVAVPALAYLLLTHCVDAYNLVRGRFDEVAKVKGRSFYASAATFVLQAAVFLQFFTLCHLLISTRFTTDSAFVAGMLTAGSQTFVLIQWSTGNTRPVQIISSAW